METSLRINEIFFSIQGESLFAGKPTVFVRTTGCPLRCTWCDTEYAFYEGKHQTIPEILEAVAKHPTRYVCLTGGEPMAQPAIVPLMQRLLALNYIVSLETSGGQSLKDVPPAVVKVVDLKCPDSGESHTIRWDNLDHIFAHDQFKFVVASKADFLWAQEACRTHGLEQKCTVLFSPVHGKVTSKDLAEWLLESGLEATMQLQLHKQIWGADARGV